jgi:hypothetical protein
MAITDALANDFEQAWRSRTGHAVGIRGGGSAYQHSPAYDAVVARCVHIHTPVLRDENSADLSGTCR